MIPTNKYERSSQRSIKNWVTLTRLMRKMGEKKKTTSGHIEKLPIFSKTKKCQRKKKMGTRLAFAKQNHEIVPQKWHLRKNPNSFYNGTKHKKLSFKFFVRRGAKNGVSEKKKDQLPILLTNTVPIFLIGLTLTQRD